MLSSMLCYHQLASSLWLELMSYPVDAKPLCGRTPIWETVPNQRGQTAYDKQTRCVVMTVRLPGALPEGLTLEVPRTEFDVWYGDKWVTDADALHSAEVAAAQTELNARVREAETAIS
ncbi:tail fiber assembly protein [Klebsiella quasipneumoniae]